MSNAAHTEIKSLRDTNAEIEHLEGLAEALFEDGDASSARDVQGKIDELAKTRDIYWGAGMHGGY